MQRSGDVSPSAGPAHLAAWGGTPPFPKEPRSGRGSAQNRLHKAPGAAPHSKPGPICIGNSGPMTIAEVHARSLRDPEGFWGEAATAITWERRWDRVLDDSRAPFYRWFVGGRLNTCFNALDRHVDAGHGNRAALIYDSPMAGRSRTYSYRELTEEVARFAGVLTRAGVTAGDRVVIYMPMVPEAGVARLAFGP